MKHFVKGLGGAMYDLKQFKWAERKDDKIIAGPHPSHPSYTVKFSVRDWQKALEREAPVVSCPPGYFVLRPPGIEVDEKHLRREAVVVWRIAGDKAIPITVDPPMTSYELDYAVEFPDGHVEADNTSWVSVDQYCSSNGLGPVELLDE